MNYLSKTIHNIQKKKITSHVHTGKCQSVTGYHFEINGKPTAPCDLGLSHKNLTKLYFEVYQVVGCSYMDMLLGQIRYAKFLNVSFKHKNITELDRLKARLDHVKSLLNLRVVYKGVSLFEDSDGEIFTISHGYKRMIFKSVLAFKQYVTKNVTAITDN